MTAVQWLANMLEMQGTITPLDISQAKEMEKQQIIEAHAVGRLKECIGINTDGEQYYNKTYKK
jgi:hypothetical protein